MSVKIMRRLNYYTNYYSRVCWSESASYSIVNKFHTIESLHGDKGFRYMITAKQPDKPESVPDFCRSLIEYFCEEAFPDGCGIRLVAENEAARDSLAYLLKSLNKDIDINAKKQNLGIKKRNEVPIVNRIVKFNLKK